MANRGTMDDLIKRIDEMEKRHQREIDALRDNFNHRMRAMAEQITSLMPLHLSKGHFPTDADKIELQLFHTETLTAKDINAGKAHWSCRITFWKDGHKANSDVALFGPDKFRKAAKGQPGAVLAKLAETMREGMVAGMNRVKTHGKGRPYAPDEIVLVTCPDDEPNAALFIGDKAIQFPEFVPGKGTERGHAIWYTSWPPKEKRKAK